MIAMKYWFLYLILCCLILYVFYKPKHKENSIDKFVINFRQDEWVPHIAQFYIDETLIYEFDSSQTYFYCSKYRTLHIKHSELDGDTIRYDSLYIDNAKNINLTSFNAKIPKNYIVLIKQLFDRTIPDSIPESYEITPTLLRKKLIEFNFWIDGDTVNIPKNLNKYTKMDSLYSFLKKDRKTVWSRYNPKLTISFIHQKDTVSYWIRQNMNHYWNCLGFSDDKAQCFYNPQIIKEVNKIIPTNLKLGYYFSKEYLIDLYANEAGNEW